MPTTRHRGGDVTRRQRRTSPRRSRSTRRSPAWNDPFQPNQPGHREPSDCGPRGTRLEPADSRATRARPWHLASACRGHSPRGQRTCCRAGGGCLAPGSQLLPVHAVLVHFEPRCRCRLSRVEHRRSVQKGTDRGLPRRAEPWCLLRGRIIRANNETDAALMCEAAQGSDADLP
jgi:hypothetical protein